ncbi:MAG: hypothetical protein HND48_18545 [Chloroflexi bacterium]|nr:hypothetical protein [Chloroflexota bacterium]
MSHGRRHVGLKLALALAPLLIIGTFIVAQPPRRAAIPTPNSKCSAG